MSQRPAAIITLATILSYVTSSIPQQPRGAAASDPDLEPGFPVRVIARSGMYHAGPAVNTLVGNIDADPQLEMVVSALSRGPLYAWNHDGSPLNGWPLQDYRGVGYAALGQIAPNDAALEVVAGYFGFGSSPGSLVAYDGDGRQLPGWPREASNFVASPPALADIDAGGIDEVFTEEESWNLHGYRAHGKRLSGWPQHGDGGQEFHTPAIGDIDGDGDLEVVAATGALDYHILLYAWHHTGATVSGFPLKLERGWPDTFPVLGDVDGDGQTEIVVVVDREDGSTGQVAIISNKGVVERRVDLPVSSGFTAPALADMNGGGPPEIIVQAGNSLTVLTGSGTTLPGWPISFDMYGKENSSPVVGDVDGDGAPDIAVTVRNWYTSESEVRLYSRTGQLHPRFPKKLPLLGGGAVPAIADLDLDGRNELVVTGDYWEGLSGEQEKVWVYDLKGRGPYGPVAWGQFGGGPDHRGSFPQITTAWPPRERIIAHERSVGLRLRRHLAARGRVFVKDGFRPCARRVPVSIHVFTGTSWATAARTRTNLKGRYRRRITDESGRFHASIDFSYRGKNGEHVCLRDTSPIRVHKH